MRTLIAAVVATMCTIVVPAPAQAADGVPTFSHVGKAIS